METCLCIHIYIYLYIYMYNVYKYTHIYRYMYIETYTWGGFIAVDWAKLSSSYLALFPVNLCVYIYMYI
jgi:hypothetical protein